MLVISSTDEVSHPETSREIREVQPSNIAFMLRIDDVSHPETFKDESDEQS